MDQFSGGMNWSMIPNVQGQGNFVPSTNHDQQLFLQQEEQFHQQQQQDMQQFQQQQHYIQQHQRLLHTSPPLQPQSLQSPPQSQTVVLTPQSIMHTPPQQQQQQQMLVQTPQQHQSLASHFHLYPMVEKLTDAIENGTRYQNSDALVTELNSHFDKCQQLLNSISGSLGSKTMTVDGQKRNVEESEHLLQQRRGLIVEYRKSIEEIMKI